jgi:hypothetical protein
MKKIKVFSLTVLFCATMAFGFSTPAYSQHKASPELRIHKRVQKLKQQLELTDDQATKIESIYLDREQKMAHLPKDSTTDPKAFKKQKRAINKNATNQISGLLSEQQRQKWQAMKAKKKQMPAKSEE